MPALHFTQEENAVLLAAVSAALQQLEQAEKSAGIVVRGRAWMILNSLRTLFAEQGYGLERTDDPRGGASG